MVITSQRLLRDRSFGEAWSPMRRRLPDQYTLSGKTVLAKSQPMSTRLHAQVHVSEAPHLDLALMIRQRMVTDLGHRPTPCPLPGTTARSIARPSMELSGSQVMGLWCGLPKVSGFRGTKTRPDRVAGPRVGPLPRKRQGPPIFGRWQTWAPFRPSLCSHCKRVASTSDWQG